MLTPPQTQFLALAATAAVQSERITGVPAELTLPQAIFESGWGSKAPYGNCFGLKANGRGCGSFVIPTTEYIGGKPVIQQLAFEKYASLTDCFADHGWLISQGKPYAMAFARFKADHNRDALMLAVGKIYATAPNYGQQVLDFSKSSAIVDALAKARAAAVA